MTGRRGRIPSAAGMDPGLSLLLLPRLAFGRSPLLRVLRYGVTSFLILAYSTQHSKGDIDQSACSQLLSSLCIALQDTGWYG